jgi:hypothetical protein
LHTSCRLLLVELAAVGIPVGLALGLLGLPAAVCNCWVTLLSSPSTLGNVCPAGQQPPLLLLPPPPLLPLLLLLLLLLLPLQAGKLLLLSPPLLLLADVFLAS